jgi:hypothetical protein
VIVVLLLLLSILLTRLRCHSMKLFLSSIELLTLTRSSVSVSCVLLSLCLVCFCLETAAAVERDAMDWTAGYGWLWLVLRFSLVLGTEFELSVAVQEGAGQLWNSISEWPLRRMVPCAKTLGKVFLKK